MYFGHRTECDRCGRLVETGTVCQNPYCGEKAAPSFFQTFLSPVVEIAALPFKSSPRSSSSSSGDGATILFYLIAIALVGLAIFWFVTVVLPIILGIVAAVYALKWSVKAFRACVARYGLAKTLKGIGLTVAVPSLIAAYVANFTGDFEADSTGHGRSEPRLASESCGYFSEGDNLSYAGGSQHRDTLGGRFVFLSVHGVDCWVPLRSLRYQRGVVMSLIGTVYDLGTTQRDDQSARLQALRDFDAETAAAAQSGRTESLTAALERVRRDRAEVLPATALRLEHHDAAERYRAILETFRLAADEDREALHRAAMALPAPTDKRDFESAYAEWLAMRCRALAADPALRTSSFGLRTRLTVSAATACASVNPDPFAAVLTGLAEGIRLDRTASVAETFERLQALSLARPNDAGLRAARDAAMLSFRTHQREVASLQGRRVRAAAVVAARAALAGSAELPPLEPRDRERLQREIELDGLRAGGALLRELFSDDRALRVALRLAVFNPPSSVVPQSLLASPRLWRVDTAAAGSGLDRVRVSFRPRSPDNDSDVTIDFCFHAGSETWFPCAPMGTGEGR